MKIELSQKEIQQIYAALEYVNSVSSKYGNCCCDRFICYSDRIKSNIYNLKTKMKTNIKNKETVEDIRITMDNYRG